MPGISTTCSAIQGEQQYLWRASDQDGDTIDILVQRRGNKKAVAADAVISGLERSGVCMRRVAKRIHVAFLSLT